MNGRNYAAAVSTAEVALRDAMRGALFRTEVPTESDLCMCTDLYTLTLLLIFDTHPVLQEDKRWACRVVTQLGGCADKLVFLDALQSLDDAVINIFHSQSEPTAAYFKGRMGAQWRFVAPFVVPILRAEPDPVQVLGLLHQIAAFPLRVTFSKTYEAASAVDRFLENEAFTRTPHQIDGLRGFFKSFSQEVDPVFSDTQPRHGNGAVWDAKRSVVAKYQALGTDALIHYLCVRTGWPEYGQSFVRKSEFLEVPKSYCKRRGICLESATLQYYQQGVFRVILAAIKRSRLRRHIDLEHPEFNEYLALEGSIRGLYTTIDLSDASDLVSWRLVKNATQGTWLYPLLLCTRSRKVQVDNELVEIAKYAAMGSATTFIVECLIFAALVEFGITREGGSPNRSNWRVYGDDIVVEKFYHDSVVDALEEFGFKVNTRKSFSSTGKYIFRESCGGEFLNGRDITPVRISRFWRGLNASYDPVWFVKQSDLCNSFYVAKLPSPRRWLIRRLNSLPTRLRPLFSNDFEQGIFSPNPTLYRNRVKWDRDIQEYIAIHGAARQCTNLCTNDAWRLWEHLRSTRDRESLLYPEDLVSVDDHILLRKLTPAVTGTAVVPNYVTKVGGPA